MLSMKPDNIRRRTKAYHERSKVWIKRFKAEQDKRWGVGTVGQGHSQNAKNAELIAMKILTKLGYENIQHWALSGNLTFMYDITAECDHVKYVFQVTTYTYTKKKLSHRFAKWAGLIHKVIFISLKRNEYVIKDFSNQGFARLSQKDEELAIGFTTTK